MQRYTILFIIVNALHVSGGFCAHHQKLKTCILLVILKEAHNVGQTDGKVTQT
jgi:hypothetical protein